MVQGRSSPRRSLPDWRCHGTSCRQPPSPHLPHHNRHYVQSVSSRKSFLPQVFLGEHLLYQSNEQSTCFGPCCKPRAQGRHSLLGRTVTITLCSRGPSVTLLGFYPRFLLYMTMVKWIECRENRQAQRVNGRETTQIRIT